MDSLFDLEALAEAANVPAELLGPPGASAGAVEAYTEPVRRAVRRKRAEWTWDDTLGAMTRGANAARRRKT